MFPCRFVWTLILVVATSLAVAACSDDTSPVGPDAGPGADGAVVDGKSTLPDSKTSTPDAGCTLDMTPEDDITVPKLYTPRWAFEPWISKDISSQTDTYSFVSGFEQRDIPVGVVVIDSPWETNYNTFVPNPTRYPDLKKLVSDLHAKHIKVVMWATQMVNSGSFDLESGGDKYPGPSPNFAPGLACGFFINEGTTYPWWKGGGAGVDFFNPRAMRWWHRQQDHTLNMGIDGWKLDFGESYILQDPVITAAGSKTLQAYSEAYYRDTWAYGVHKRGKQFLTMVRGYDKSYQFEGRFFARPEHAPVVWAGDNRRDWVGLADALDHMLRSAEKGYVVVGSDIGGYLDFDDKDSKVTVPFDQENFVRWVAVGGMSPFMQLHGRANLAPWTVTVKATETTAAYRYWAWLHREMVPYWYSASREAQLAGKGLLDPVAAQKDWPGDYSYVVGQAFLVAPLLDATGKRDVKLPAGSTWYDWWNPGAAALSGGATVKADHTKDQKQIPVFVKGGAIVPLHVQSDVTGLGGKACKGHLTVAVWPDQTKSSFKLHEEDGTTTTTLTAQVDTMGQATLTAERTTGPTLFRVRQPSYPSGVTQNGTKLTELKDLAALTAAAEGYAYDATQMLVWVKVGKSTTKVTVVVEAM